jgi:hypothetical protein
VTAGSERDVFEFVSLDDALRAAVAVLGVALERCNRDLLVGWEVKATAGCAAEHFAQQWLGGHGGSLR